MSAVLVVRGQGIWLAMNDEFGKTCKVGEVNNFKVKGGAAGKFREVDPIASVPSNAKPAKAERTLP